MYWLQTDLRDLNMCISIFPIHLQLVCQEDTTRNYSRRQGHWHVGVQNLLAAKWQCQKTELTVWWMYFTSSHTLININKNLVIRCDVVVSYCLMQPQKNVSFPVAHVSYTVANLLFYYVFFFYSATPSTLKCPVVVLYGYWESDPSTNLTMGSSGDLGHHIIHNINVQKWSDWHRSANPSWQMIALLKAPLKYYWLHL